MESDSRSSWVLGLSLVEVVLLLAFAGMIVYVADNVEGRGQGLQQSIDETKITDTALQAKLDAAAEKNNDLEKQLGDITLLVEELKLMVGAKVSSREGFQEAIDSLRRGYALCQKDNNTLIEASMQNGVESLQVIGDIPFDLDANLVKGDRTSDMDQIVSFIQDVYQYEKDHSCRFNYRLKYATDNDYRKAREGFERYFYPEKMIRTG